MKESKISTMQALLPHLYAISALQQLEIETCVHRTLFTMSDLEIKKAASMITERGKS
jgi:hypothetical protein